MWPSSQVWSTFRHIRKEEHHNQWAVLSGISPTVEKGCTKDTGEDREIKEKGVRWEGGALVVVWWLHSFPWVDLERKCHFQWVCKDSGLLNFCWSHDVELVGFCTRSWGNFHKIILQFSRYQFVNRIFLQNMVVTKNLSITECDKPFWLSKGYTSDLVMHFLRDWWAGLGIVKKNTDTNRAAHSIPIV